MSEEFQPEKYHDEYQVGLREIIEAKISGKEVVQTPDAPQTNAISIMDALKDTYKMQKAHLEKSFLTPSKMGFGASYLQHEPVEWVGVPQVINGDIRNSKTCL